MSELETISSVKSAWRWCARMTARSPHESHRAATPLELFFDLVFVVAIAQAANGLHHAVAEVTSRRGALRLPDGVLRHLVGVDGLHLVCVGVRLRRCAVSIAGVRADRWSIAARGGYHGDVRNADAEHCDGRRLRHHAAGAGRAVAACGGVRSWASNDGTPIRSRHHDHADRVGRHALHPASVGGGIPASCRARCSVPMWAERASPTPWHPHHITERYGLLTLIVLGESILAANSTIQSALAAGAVLSALLAAIVGGSAHRVLDVVDVLRPSRSRSADERSQGVHVGLRSLLRVRVRRGGRCRARGRRGRCHAHFEGRPGGRRRRSRRSSRDVSGVPLGPARPARVSADPIVRPDQRCSFCSRRSRGTRCR